MVKLSIIIPCLNVVRYIRECMDSAINQTIRNIEILVIDGGSTDGTVEILKEYADKDSRVTLVHSDIKSYGYQVNMGLDRANGEYVAVLESDDYVDLSMYEKLCKVADENQTDITKADFDKFFSLTNGYREFTKVSFWKDEPDNYNRVLNPRDHRILFCNDYFLWKGVYRRSFINENNIRLHETKGAAFQDIGFLQQVMASAKRVIYIEDSFYRYRTDRDESSSYSPKVLKYGYDEFTWLLDMHDKGEKELYLPGLCSHMMQAFTGEMWISLKATGYDMESEYIRPYYDWFKDKLTQFIECGIADMNELYDITKEQFFEIFDNVETYIGKCRSDIGNGSIIQKVQSVSNGEKLDIIIFGSGQRGKSYIRQLDGICNICAIADNNAARTGETYMGFEVLSPEECTEQFKDDLYVIAVKGHETEIAKQLIKLGITKVKIIANEDIIL